MLGSAAVVALAASEDDPAVFDAPGTTTTEVRVAGSDPAVDDGATTEVVIEVAEDCSGVAVTIAVEVSGAAVVVAEEDEEEDVEDEEEEVVVRLAVLAK